ncbi:hypothetical protein GCM10009865_52800 [Aeromicrobium ponti]|uniref:Uncharacterized protein n=1 Tax=Cytobacillus oceanisediminis TaxID=665099 RepID=A0A562J5W9_9BACI|nr:hypothetical protein [Cytobacillus oceanisediminis]TWH78530.1 hypothetical protein IQ19_05294 [Cytobacillus oceanisediminis]
MKHADSLSEAVDFAKEESQGRIFISQSEAYPGGMVLGDEDSASGAPLKMKVQILAESQENSVYFQQEYEDEILYKEAVSQIEELKETTDYELLKPSEMEEKVQKY